MQEEIVFSVEQLARIEQGEVLSDLRAAPHFSTIVETFSKVDYDILRALNELGEVAPAARGLRTGRNVLQGQYRVAANNVQLNRALGLAWNTSYDLGITRLSKSDEPKERELAANLRLTFISTPADASVRDVRDTVDEQSQFLEASLTDVPLASLGLRSSFLTEAKVIVENFAARTGNAAITSSARQRHTALLHEKLERLGELIAQIEVACVQLEDLGIARPGGFDMGILLSAAAGNGPRDEPVDVIPNPAPTPADADNSETAGLPPLAPLGEA